MNSFFTYYVLWILLTYALRQPWLLVGLGVLLVLRRFIPSPAALVRLFGRARTLRTQVELNRANITARRDLAVIYLDGRRARAAIPLLEEGLSLAPNDAELLYLLGLAFHRVGRHEDALAPLVRAVELDPRVRYGLPYAVAGDALAALGRWDAALDAYEHYIADNGSDVSAYTRLARAHAKTGDREAARRILHEGLRTYGGLPGSMRRRQFKYYVGAHWARATILREPSAVALALGVAVFSVILARLLYAPVVGLFERDPYAPRYGHRGMSAERRALYEANARCGTQSTGDFEGSYAVLPNDAHGAQNDERSANVKILRDRITSGAALVEEYCLTGVTERTPTTLRADAIWWRDAGEPDVASMVSLTLTRAGDRVRLSVRRFHAPESAAAFVLELRRAP